MLTLVATALEFHYSRFFNTLAHFFLSREYGQGESVYLLFCHMGRLGLCASSFHLSSDERSGLENFPHQICNGRREGIGIPVEEGRAANKSPH